MQYLVEFLYSVLNSCLLVFDNPSLILIGVHTPQAPVGDFSS